MSTHMRMHETGVAVWHFPSQKFVSFVPCPGEKRVRIDAYDELDNYAVYAVKYTGTASFDIPVDLSGPPRPLVDWRIDYT